MNAYANHGQVLICVEGRPLRTLKDGRGYAVLSRKEAIDMLADIAQAVQHAGDICEPEAVFAREAIGQLVASYSRLGPYETPPSYSSYGDRSESSCPDCRPGQPCYGHGHGH